jgi:hypothetical protein
MSRSKIFLVLFAVNFLALPCLAQTGIPDLSHSLAFIAYDGPGTPSLLVVPDGNGRPFTEAHDEDGNLVDATITLYMLDVDENPIASFPFEDLWLESMDSGLVFCNGGTTADHNTDPNGQTEWVNPLFAGGHSPGPVLVLINGAALDTNPGLPLKFNSPDITGDLVVNLYDLQVFSEDYFSDYQFRCDFFGDGALNLVDVVVFAQNYLAQCP